MKRNKLLNIILNNNKNNKINNLIKNFNPINPIY